jgi:uncharacterized membrane protein HdeD (DUF308 family)
VEPTGQQPATAYLAPPSAVGTPLHRREVTVIALGIVLLIVGLVLHIGILWTIEIILLASGAILFLLGFAGHAVGGRRHYW